VNKGFFWASTYQRANSANGSFIIA